MQTTSLTLYTADLSLSLQMLLLLVLQSRVINSSTTIIFLCHAAAIRRIVPTAKATAAVAATVEATTQTNRHGYVYVGDRPCGRGTTTEWLLLLKFLFNRHP